MSFIFKLTDYLAERARSFTAFEFGLLKLTMFFLGAFCAACTPRFARRSRGALGVIATMLTGTLIGYLFFGGKYFELEPSKLAKQDEDA